MPFNPDDFAPKPSGFNPDEFLPSGKTGFNPDEFLPKEQAQAFNPDGFLPVTQNDFKSALGNIRDAVIGAVKEQISPILNTPPVAGAGAVRGATLGYIDPTKAQAVQALDVDPLTRQRAEVVGEFAGAAAPITGIAKGVAAGAKMSQAVARMTPWLRGVAEAGAVGGIYGAAKKPKAESLAERAENARDDAALFMAFAATGAVAGKVAEAVKSSDWYRKLTVPERAVALSKYPNLDLPDAEMMEVFNNSPEGVQKVLADRNPKMRRILQTGSSAEPVAQPARPVEEPLFPIEAKAPEAAQAPAKRLTDSDMRQEQLTSQIETAKSALVERPTAPVEGWKSEPVQGGGTSLESPGGYRVFVPEGQDPAKAAAAIREIERAEYGASQIPEAQAPIETPLFEGEQYAQKTGAQVEGSGQEVKPPERQGTGVYLRDTAKDGVEAAKGEIAIPPVEPPPPTPPVTEKPMPEPKKTNPRGFINTVKESGMTTEGMREEVLGIKPQDYEQLPNADVLKGADDVIAKKGTVKALEELMANENPSIEDTAVAIRLMKIYENRGDYDKVIPLIDKFDSVFRKSGRTVQLASLWNRLTPSGFSKTIERTLEKLGVKIDEDFKKVLIKKMEEIKRMPEGPDRTQATFELLNSVYDKVPFVAKAENLIDAYRYTNMLSSPLTHERNLYGNTMQTFLTRPLDMIGEWTYDMARHPFNPIARDIKLLDIPKYYQSVFKTIPEAGAAFLKALGSNSVSTKVVESPTEGVNFINEAMRANLPKALRVIPNLMEASDRFFGILVAAGEKARLMRGGMAEAEAEIKAKELAEKILYRQRLGGMKKGEGPVLVRALDELGKIVLSARNYPVIGKPISWFAPFVTTPINIAKASVERSPFGFFGGKYDDEQMGKALIGSLVALLGLSMSLAGKVVWMPPRSKKGKTAFYESGRLPLSVEVGGKYIPAWYFGPYALSFMLPEAFRYQMQENEKKLTPNNMAAIAKAVVASGRLITEQTPMAGVKDLTAIATGESTLSSEIVARPASQMMPFVGALRFVANIVDPIYRDGDGLVDELKKSVPTLTKDLEAYKKLDGTPSTRSLSSLYLPYAINERDARADMAFRGIMERERRKSIQREKRKKLREGE